MATKQKGKKQEARPQGAKKPAKPSKPPEKKPKAAAKAASKVKATVKAAPKALKKVAAKLAPKKASKPEPAKKAQKPPKAAKPARPAAPAKPAVPGPQPTATRTAPSPTPSSPPPSSAPSRSFPTPSASSPTDGGVRYLSVNDVIELHRAVSAEFGGNQAHPGVVESQFGLVSAVQRPQITTLGREAYPSFSDKVAAFIFALVQSRPFRGGNRRVALASLVAFCELNNRTVDTRVFDEKTAETLIRRAANCREMGIPPENVFRELREVMSRAITTQ